MMVISTLGILYYQTHKELVLSEKRADLAKYAYIQTRRLKVLHHFFDERTDYPRDPRFRSAIYDIEYKQIFSLLKNQSVDFQQEIYFKDGVIQFVKSMDIFYLGAKYLIIEIDDGGEWHDHLIKKILGYGSLALFLFIFFGYYLAKLFVKPMRDSIMLLDRFIKDTTHELNTPLSAILANIEMMDTSVMVEKNKQKLNRINIAAKTVSVLYKDLTYLTLEQEKEYENERIEIEELLYDRLEYFRVLAQSKGLSYEMDIHHAEIIMDRRKLTRVIDNLLSNAIKYNKRKGIVGIRLREGSLEIWDTGVGISEEEKILMFDRYRRFNETEGGFGIGLSIVKKILDEYSIKIEVFSKKDEGTRMVLKW
ncbi:HAMP domain-containing sensor histidine kinase [Sulfurovum sp. zt1-1]|uniref:histidine kinase n=2 Tax=Sulfurovum zhangzhouensis TaxID=3019067 RepID=A0ABT7QYB7_9BACT|nr:HAMP domain-containing sensor histidine kinase [Sulfurovum zhangzhouensis]